MSKGLSPHTQSALTHSAYAPGLDGCKEYFNSAPRTPARAGCIGFFIFFTEMIFVFAIKIDVLRGNLAHLTTPYTPSQVLT